MYFNKLRHQFIKNLEQEINPFFESKKTGPKQRRTDQTIVEIVVALRKQNYAITDIRAALHAKDHVLSLDTIHTLTNTISIVVSHMGYKINWRGKCRCKECRDLEILDCG